MLQWNVKWHKITTIMYIWGGFFMKWSRIIRLCFKKWFNYACLNIKIFFLIFVNIIHFCEYIHEQNNHINTTNSLKLMPRIRKHKQKNLEISFAFNNPKEKYLWSCMPTNKRIHMSIIMAPSDTLKFHLSNHLNI